MDTADIIITLPSTVKWSDYRKELNFVFDGQNVLRFKVPHLPKKNIDRCYLVWQGKVRGWMKVTGVFEGNFTCSVTGNVWQGKFIERSGPFHELLTVIPMKGFQGFRYFDRNITKGTQDLLL